MAQQLPAIIVIAPLVISFLIFISGLWYKKIAYLLAVMAMSICLLAAVGILQWVMVDGTISYWLAGWQPPWGIEYRIDHLNAVMLVLVSLLGLLAAVHANSSVLPIRIRAHFHGGKRCPLC
jgi:multicomponent Na+:H+ antiporter subunit D